MITITKFRRFEKEGGSLLGFFDLDWNGFFVKDCSLFHREGEKWFSFPSKKYQKDDKVGYSPYCGHVEPSMREAFRKEVIKAIDAFLSLSKAQEIAQETPF